METSVRRRQRNGRDVMMVSSSWFRTVAVLPATVTYVPVMLAVALFVAAAPAVVLMGGDVAAVSVSVICALAGLWTLRALFLDAIVVSGSDLCVHGFHYRREQVHVAIADAAGPYESVRFVTLEGRWAVTMPMAEGQANVMWERAAGSGRQHRLFVPVVRLLRTGMVWAWFVTSAGSLTVLARLAAS